MCVGVWQVEGFQGFDVPEDEFDAKADDKVFGSTIDSIHQTEPLVSTNGMNMRTAIHLFGDANIFREATN